MADEEKLIAAALQTVFKCTKIPTDLYEKLQHELKVDDSEIVKVNMTLKRGLVLDIEDDSHFRTFLNINDIVLTVNDKVANRPDFRLHDLFKERGCKTFAFTYIRMKCYTEDRPTVEDNERKDGYDYRVFALFHYQRVPMGLIMQSFLGAKVMVMEVAAKTIGSMCMLPGDCILAINGVRQANDAGKTLETMASEIENKGFVRITVERPTSEVAKATAAFTIQTDHRDLPVPGDCAAYVKEAIRVLTKAPEPKSIMKAPSDAGTETARVGFHTQIYAESIIPSDIADEKLVRTPARVPGAPPPTAMTPPPAPPPPQQPQSPTPSAERIEKEPSIMGKPPSVHEELKKPPPPAKDTKKSKVSKKGSGSESKSKGSRKRPSAEPIVEKNKKKAATPGSGAGGKSKPKKKSKKAPESHTATGGDTEGTGL